MIHDAQRAVLDDDAWSRGERRIGTVQRVSLSVCCAQFHSTLLTYMDVSECALSQVPKGFPSSTRYAQLRRNNISSLSRTAFVECPFASIVVLDDNRIDDVDQQAGLVIIAVSEGIHLTIISIRNWDNTRNDYAIMTARQTWSS